MALNPKIETWWRRASELLAEGDHVRAASQLERLIKAAPQDPSFRYNLSVCLFQMGRPDEAIIHLNRARQLGLADTTADVLAERIAQQFHANNRLDDAIEVLRDLARKWPGDTMRLLRLADLMREAGRFGEALDLLGRVVAEGRDAAYILNSQGLIHQNTGDLAAARACFLKALETDPALGVTYKNLRYLTLNTPGLSAEETFAFYRDLAARVTPPGLPDVAFDNDRSADRPLRIAYVSSDFRMHVVGLNILPLIENHDRKSVELYFYSDVPQDDQITMRFQAHAKAWRPIAGKSDADVAAAIRADKIDIAVFLAGSFDANRPQLAAYRVAPVQVSYHDCATSGFDAMDYLIGDDVIAPADTKELFSEDVFRLPVFYQYEKREVPDSLPEPPCRKAGFVTFGSFNKPEKINTDVVALWARVLAAVPDSKLFLKYFDFYKGPEARRRILDGFAQHGIGADRLIFKTGFDTSGAHLSLYDSIDIALDTFPFAGATTTFEALGRGVPVVSLLGERFVARYAGAILTHAGLAHLACRGADAYLEAAKGLAAYPDALAALKQTLPVQLAASPLCDNVAYARAFEAAYREMWSRYLAV